MRLDHRCRSTHHWASSPAGLRFLDEVAGYEIHSDPWARFRVSILVPANILWLAKPKPTSLLSPCVGWPDRTGAGFRFHPRKILNGLAVHPASPKGPGCH